MGSGSGRGRNPSPTKPARIARGTGGREGSPQGWLSMPVGGRGEAFSATKTQAPCLCSQRKHNARDSTLASAANGRRHFLPVSLSQRPHIMFCVGRGGGGAGAC